MVPVPNPIAHNPVLFLQHQLSELRSANRITQQLHRRALQDWLNARSFRHHADTEHVKRSVGWQAGDPEPTVGALPGYVLVPSVHPGRGLVSELTVKLDSEHPGWTVAPHLNTSPQLPEHLYKLLQAWFRQRNLPTARLLGGRVDTVPDPDTHQQEVSGDSLDLPVLLAMGRAHLPNPESLGSIAATGKLDLATGKVLEVQGIEKKLDALFREAPALTRIYVPGCHREKLKTDSRWPDGVLVFVDHATDVLDQDLGSCTEDLVASGWLEASRADVARYLELAEAAYDRYRFGQVERLTERVLQLGKAGIATRGDEIRARVWLASAHVATGNVHRTTAALTDVPPAHALKGVLRNDQIAQLVAVQAEAALDRFEFAAAAQTIAEARKERAFDELDPKSRLKLLSIQARAWTWLEQPRESIAQLEACVNLAREWEPDQSPRHLNYLGLAHRVAGDAATAVELHREALRACQPEKARHTGVVFAEYYLASALLQAGEQEAARAALADFYAHRDDSPAFYPQALLLCRLAEAHDSRAIFAEALARVPDNAVRRWKAADSVQLVLRASVHALLAHWTLRHDERRADDACDTWKAAMLDLGLQRRSSYLKPACDAVLAADTRADLLDATTGWLRRIPYL